MRQDLEPRPIRIVIRRPSEFGVGCHSSRKLQFCGRCGRKRQLPERFGISPGYIAHECEIQVLHLVAILGAALGARGLVLVAIVLKRLCETNGGEAGSVEM